MRTKSILGIVLALLALFVSFAPSAQAGWNDIYGIGDGAGNSFFSASGAPLSVVDTVQSNTVYVLAGGPSAPGSPLYQSIWIKTDLATATLNFYVPIDEWPCASNQMALTNVVWVKTNANALSTATNDLCVIQHADGTAQLLLLGHALANASGQVSSNTTLGQSSLGFRGNVTNAIAVGDIVYRLKLRHTFTPLSMGNITNDVPVVLSQWFGVSTRAAPLVFNGVLGKPTVITLTHTAAGAGGLNVNGVFKRREL